MKLNALGEIYIEPGKGSEVFEYEKGLKQTKVTATSTTSSQNTFNLKSF